MQLCESTLCIMHRGTISWLRIQATSQQGLLMFPPEQSSGFAVKVSDTFTLHLETFMLCSHTADSSQQPPIVLC